MNDFTEPTGERAELLLSATQRCLEQGQTISTGEPELSVLQTIVGGDVSQQERDWAYAMFKRQNPAHPAFVGPGDAPQDVPTQDDPPSQDPPAPPPNEPKAKERPMAKSDIQVECAQCKRKVEKVDRVLDHKVYVVCHGARQGLPTVDADGNKIHDLVAFKS